MCTQPRRDRADGQTDTGPWLVARMHSVTRRVNTVVAQRNATCAAAQQCRVAPHKTRSSAIAEGPRDASCQ